MRRVLLLLAILFLLPLTAHANENIQGWCEDGSQIVITSGLQSTTQVQASYPQCSVTVLVHGGGTATIYSNNSGAVLSNPFTASTNGQFEFYVAQGRYDVVLSGAGLPATVTFPDIIAFDPAQFGYAQCALSFTTTPVLNAATCSLFSMTLTNNVVATNITGALTGQEITISLCQDATGGRTFVWPASFIDAPTISPAPSSCSNYTFVLLTDGHWHEISSGASAPVQSPLINNVLYVDAKAYPPTGAGLSQAIASLAGQPGIVAIDYPGIYSDATITPTNGAVLQFGAGVYNICNISGVDSTTVAVTWSVVGQGREKTRFKLSDGCNKAGITDQNFASLNAPAYPSGNFWGVFHPVLEGFTIDCNRATQTGTHACIELYGRGGLINDVVEQNSIGDGIFISWNGTQNYTYPVPGPQADLTWVVSNSNMLFNHGNGLTGHASSDENFSNLTTFGNDGWGYEVFYSAFVSNVNAFLSTLGGCHVNQATNSGASLIGSGAECTSASGYGLKIDTQTGGTNLSSSIFACNNCIGVDIANQNDVLSGSFENSNPAIKFEGSGSTGHTITGGIFANQNIINWNSGGAASSVSLVGAGNSGTMYTGTLPTGDYVYISDPSLPNPQGGGISTLSISAPGTSYLVGDQFIINCGDNNALGQVATLSGSGVATFALNFGGSSCLTGATTTTTTKGAGSGLTLNITAVTSPPLINIPWIQGPPGFVNATNTWNYLQTYKNGGFFNNNYFTTAHQTYALQLGVVNNTSSNDTGEQGYGAIDICSGTLNCGVGFSIGNGGGTNGWNTAMHVEHYANSGIHLAAHISGAVDILNNPPADDSYYFLEETNTAQSGNVFTVNHTGDLAAHTVTPANGFTGSKTAGSCVLTITSGIITNVTGC